MLKKKVGNYIMEGQIGAGSFGEVYYAKDMHTKKEFAIKMISRSKMSSRLQDYLGRETKILQMVDNPHIIKLKDLKVSERNYYLIFEYCNGGDLFDYKKAKKGKVNEIIVRHLLRQIVDGLCAIYESGGIHRDIKLRNILLHYPTEKEKANDEAVAKVCDLGFARLVEKAGELEMSIVGTPLNMSPELIHQKPYTVKSDMWSLGTITYELLCGNPVFVGVNLTKLKKAIEAGKYKIEKSLLLSSEAIDFLTSCLQYDYKQRINWKELKTHPFICTTIVTPFCFEAFKKSNPQITHGKNNEKYYIFDSKVKYKFTSLYNKAKKVKEPEPKPELNKKQVQDKVKDIQNKEDANSEQAANSEEAALEQKIDEEYVLI